MVDSQNRALVAGAVTEKGALRGYVFARPVYGESGLPPLFEHWFLPHRAYGDICADDYAPFLNEAADLIGEVCGSFVPQ